VETVRDFILEGTKITADGDCSHEIKKSLFLGRKAVTNLDSILKSRFRKLTTKDIKTLRITLYKIFKDIKLQRSTHNKIFMNKNTNL